MLLNQNLFLQKAIIDNDLINIDYALYNGADPTFDNCIGLRYACYTNNFDMFNLFYKYNAVNPAADDNFCVNITSEKNHHEILEILLKDNRIDPINSGHYPLKIATLRYNTECVKLLLNDERIDPNICYAAFIEAVYCQKTEIIKLYLQHKNFDVSVDGKLVFEIVDRNNQYEIIKILLNKKNVIDTLDENMKNKYVPNYKPKKLVY